MTQYEAAARLAHSGNLAVASAMGLGYLGAQPWWLHVVFWPSLVFALVFGTVWLVALVFGDRLSVEKP